MPWNRLMKYMQKMFSVAEWNMSEAREREKEPRKENYAGFHGFRLCGKTNRFCLISIPLSSVAGLLEISSVVFTHISELLFFLSRAYHNHFRQYHIPAKPWWGKNCLMIKTRPDPKRFHYLLFGEDSWPCRFIHKLAHHRQSDASRTSSVQW